MKNILLADDERNITEILGRYAARLGYSTDSVHSGDAALSLLRGRPYWAVICDLVMPGPSGIEVYTALRSERNAAAERFVLMTGNILNEQQESLVAHDSTIIILEKPFDLQMFQNVLQTLESRGRP